MHNFDGIVSTLIAAVELGYLIYLLAAADKTPVNKLTIATIGLLFGYQFMEFILCFLGVQNQLLVYLALSDITLLPPLGLYTALLYSGKLQPYHKFIFIPAAFFIVYYAFMIGDLAIVKCTVIYATYYYPLGSFYGTFYYLPIIGTMIILNKKWGGEENPKKKALTRLLFFGYLFTFIPAMIIALFVPSFVQAGESLLCKMAFVLATFVTFFTVMNKAEA